MYSSAERASSGNAADSRGFAGVFMFVSIVTSPAARGQNKPADPAGPAGSTKTCRSGAARRSPSSASVTQLLGTVDHWITSFLKRATPAATVGYRHRRRALYPRAVARGSSPGKHTPPGRHALLASDGCSRRGGEGEREAGRYYGIIGVKVPVFFETGGWCGTGWAAFDADTVVYAMIEARNIEVIGEREAGFFNALTPGQRLRALGELVESSRVFMCVRACGRGTLRGQRSRCGPRC